MPRMIVIDNVDLMTREEETELIASLKDQNVDYTIWKTEGLIRR